MEINFDDLFGPKVAKAISQAANEAIQQAAEKIAESYDQPIVNQKEAAEFLQVNTKFFRNVLMPGGIPTIVPAGLSKAQYYKPHILKWYVENYEVCDGHRLNEEAER